MIHSISGIQRISDPNCGPFTTEKSIKVKAFVYSLSRTGPSWISGNISTLKNVPVVPLYFAKKRPVVKRNGTWIMIDDDRIPHDPSEVEMRMVRFRTLGCYPLSGAIESTAESVPEIIQEMMLTRMSERENRLIDFDEEGSMERKKREDTSKPISPTHCLPYPCII